MSNLRIGHEMRNCQFTHCPAMFTPYLRIVHAVNPYAVAHASIMQPVMRKLCGNVSRKLCGKYAQTVREVCAVNAQSIRNLDVNYSREQRVTRSMDTHWHALARASISIPFRPKGPLCALDAHTCTSPAP